MCSINVILKMSWQILLNFRVNTADPVHFTLTPPECHMEIRQGYGTSGNRVTGPVHVGDPLTLLIYMRSQWGKTTFPYIMIPINLKHSDINCVELS